MSPIVKKIPVKDVIVPGVRRQCDSKAICKLAESMSAIGLKTPITIRAVKRAVDPGGTHAIIDHFLVAGAHRLEAARSLGWPEIDVLESDCDEVEARRWQIAENLHRRDLTVLEHSELVSDWIELADQRPGQVVRKPNGGRPEGGIAQAARTLPISGKTKDGRRKSIARSMKIAKMSPDAKRAAQAAGLADNQSALLEIAAQPTAETQVARVAELADRKRDTRKNRRRAAAGDQIFLEAVIRYPANLGRQAELRAELARVVEEFGIELL
jgi:hypothetical protein